MKNKKLIGLATLFLALGVSGCQKPHVCSDYEMKHDENEHWEVCKECGNEKENSRKKHAFKKNDAKVDQNKDATCEEAGWTWQICSCGQEKQNEVKAKGHDYSKVKSTTATCTEAGLNTMECSRCGKESADKVEAEALGHDWAKAADQTGAIDATCLKEGTEKQSCKRAGCGATQTVPTPALGHEFTDVAGTAVAGFATLSTGTCARNDATRIFWDAKEVTDNCKNNIRVVGEGETAVEEPNYVEEGDGVRFWGRPIRNACVLQENGKPQSQSVAAPVYDPTVTGSFFEYKINVATAMNDVQLIADMAVTADLGTGPLYKADSGDWTPGLRAAENSDGYERIPVRYEVQVDSTVLEFQDVDRPCPGTSENWYTFPVNKINLAAGEHTIRISMAGGYLSTYYKFGFMHEEDQGGHEHNYVRDDTLSVDPTCTEDGRFYGVCECGIVDDHKVNKLNHNLVADPKDTDREATCSVAGQKHQKCDREGCVYEEDTVIAALGHDYVDDGEPITGTDCAPMQKANCSREDSTRYMWSAADVDQAAKESTRSSIRTDAEDQENPTPEDNYVVNRDGSVSMWGRAIHNNQPLKVDGSYGAGAAPDKVAVYDATVVGSFIEYKINVPAGGIKGVLKAEMNGAQYQSNNNVSMWAAAAQDWTPGLVDAEGTEYPTRYIIEIDGVVVEQDLANDEACQPSKAWYTVPLKDELDLAEGIHTIRFTMANGYRASFYNFAIQTPEAKVEPEVKVCDHEWAAGTPVEAADQSTYRVDYCAKCGTDRIVISAAQDINGKITAEGKKLPKGASDSYDGTAIAKYSFTLPEAIKGRLMAKVNVDNDNNWKETNGYSYYTGKNGGTSTLVTLPDGKTNTVMTVNGAAITMPTTTYFAMGITGTSADKCGIADYGEFDFVAGLNEFTLAGTDSYGLQYFEFYIDAPHAAKNFKVWNYDETKAACTGGAEKVSADGTVKMMKLGSDGNLVTLNYEAAEAGKVTLRVLCANKCANLGQKLYGNNGNKFTITVNGVAQALPADRINDPMSNYLDSNAKSGINDGGDVCVAAWIDFCDIELVAGNNEIVFKYNGGGYSMLVSGFALAK